MKYEFCLGFDFGVLSICIDTKSDEEELVPCMETLEISKKKNIQSISSYFGTQEEEDIPDMEEFEEADNLIESDPVRYTCVLLFLIVVLKPK